MRHIYRASLAGVACGALAFAGVQSGCGGGTGTNPYGGVCDSSYYLDAVEGELATGSPDTISLHTTSPVNSGKPAPPPPSNVTWSASAGTLAPGGGTTLNWTAPSKPGDVTITASFNANDGTPCTKSFVIHVVGTNLDTPAKISVTSANGNFPPQTFAAMTCADGYMSNALPDAMATGLGLTPGHSWFGLSSSAGPTSLFAYISTDTTSPFSGVAPGTYNDGNVPNLTMTAAANAPKSDTLTVSGTYTPCPKPADAGPD